MCLLLLVRRNRDGGGGMVGGGGWRLEVGVWRWMDCVLEEYGSFVWGREILHPTSAVSISPPLLDPDPDPVE